MTNAVKFWNIGRIFYDNSNKLQKHLSKLHNHHDSRISKNDVLQEPNTLGIRNTLLVMEHEPVYTAGLRDCLNASEQSKLELLGAQYRKVDRGGLATFHGPGQLTAYPVLNLRHFKPSVRWFVCRLEQTAIETCARLGITAERSPDTGVWVGENKICAIGVHVSRGVTTHGLALNCTTDLEWFNHIVPCGIEGKGVTSLSKELKRNITIDETMPIFKKSFEDVFDCSLVFISENDKKNISEAMNS